MMQTLMICNRKAWLLWNFLLRRSFILSLYDAKMRSFSKWCCIMIIHHVTLQWSLNANSICMILDFLQRSMASFRPMLLFDQLNANCMGIIISFLNPCPVYHQTDAYLWSFECKWQRQRPLASSGFHLYCICTVTCTVNCTVSLALCHCSVSNGPSFVMMWMFADWDSP